VTTRPPVYLQLLFNRVKLHIALCPEKTPEVQDLEEILAGVLADKFNTHTDDGSPRWVRRISHAAGHNSLLTTVVATAGPVVGAHV